MLVGELVLGAGCGGSLAARKRPVPTSLPTPLPRASVVSGDDWSTQSHDAERTGFQGQPVGLTSATSPQLTLKWEDDFSTPITASPLAVNAD